MKSPQSLSTPVTLVAAVLTLYGIDALPAGAQNFVSVLQDAADVATVSADIRHISEAQDAQNSSTGKTETFRERYPNGEVRIEREVTLDSEGNYVNHGAWKMWDTAGQLIADGQYNMGQRVGSWTRVLGRHDTSILRQSPFNQFKAPFTSNVTFNNDEMDGDWLIVDAEQRKCSQISLADGVRHGMAITWMPNGEVLRQAQYDQGVPVGDVLQINGSTGKLERSATYLDGRQVTSNTDYYTRAKRQKKSEEMYLAPKTVQKSADDFWNSNFASYEQQGEPLRHGLSKAWYSNGQPLSEGQYEYNKRIGQFRYWHANGQLSAEGKYQNDEYAGLWVWWHENGQKAIVGNYEDGRFAGEWRWWNELGQLSDRRMYDGTVDANANLDVERTTQNDLPELLLTK